MRDLLPGRCGVAVHHPGEGSVAARTGRRDEDRGLRLDQVRDGERVPAQPPHQRVDTPITEKPNGIAANGCAMTTAPSASTMWRASCSRVSAAWTSPSAAPNESASPVRGRGARGGEGAVHRKAYVLVIHPCVRGGAA